MKNTTSPSSSCRHLPRTELLIVGIATGVVFALLILLGLRPLENMANSFVLDDGYYAYSVARNVALGNGVTIDGSTWTNGFQPLFTFLTVPLFWITNGDRYLGIRLIYFLQVGTFSATAILLGLIARDVLPFGYQNVNRIMAATCLMYATAFGFLAKHSNGLETGLLLLGYCILWRAHQLGLFDGRRGCLRLGTMLGILVLVRIDAVFFVVVCAITASLRNGRDWSGRSLAFLQVAGLSFLVSSPWWFYNLVGFGSLMPISGQSQADWIFASNAVWISAPERLELAARALVSNSMPFQQLSHLAGRWAITMQAMLVFGLSAIIWRRQNSFHAVLLGLRTCGGRTHRTYEFVGVFLIGQATLVAYYILSSSAAYFFERYFICLALPGCVIGGLLVGLAFAESRSMLALLVAALAIPFVLMFLRTMRGDIVQNPYFYRDQLALVQDHVPEDHAVGADQSGTLGYFRNGVVNLDGKVNPEACALRGETLAIVERRGIRWLCDWPQNLELSLGAPLAECGFHEVARKGKFALYLRNP